MTKISFMIGFKLLIVILAGLYQFFVIRNSIDKTNGNRGYIRGNSLL
jgi:hypothetical protein